MVSREVPPPPEETLDLRDLVRAKHAELEEIFGRFCMSPSQALAILADSLQVLRIRQKHVRDPGGWLLAAVEDRCRRWVEEENGSEEGH